MSHQDPHQLALSVLCDLAADPEATPTERRLAAIAILRHAPPPESPSERKPEPAAAPAPAALLPSPLPTVPRKNRPARTPAELLADLDKAEHLLALSMSRDFAARFPNLAAGRSASGPDPGPPAAPRNPIPTPTPATLTSA